MAQHEHRVKERFQRRQHAEEIAKSGLKPVTMLEVNTALVALRHAMERAELAFTVRGSSQQPESDIQETALREVKLAKLQYEEKASVHNDAIASAQLDASNRIARWQFWTAVAVAAFTLLQLALAFAQAMKWIKQ